MAAWRCYSSTGETPADAMRASKLEVTRNESSGTVRVRVPLPTRGATMFSLLPGSRMQSLLDDIRREDHGVESARVFDSEGNAVAGSTPVFDLSNATLDVAINDRVYALSLPDVLSSSSGDSGGAAHLGAVVDRMNGVVESLRRDQEERERIRAEATAIEEQLAPMESLRTECQERASRRARVLAWAGLGFLSLQFGFLARLTWWEYSWDLMEPVTYFVTIGTDLILFGYFVLTRTSFSAEAVKERSELKTFYKLAKKRGMDVSEYNALKQRLEECNQKLRY